MARPKTGWSNVRTPVALLEEIDRAIAESRGAFTSRADFVKAAIREKLDRKEEVLLAHDVFEAIKRSPELRRLIRKR